MGFLIFVAVVLVLVYRGSTPEERTQFAEKVLPVVRRLREKINLRVAPVTSFLIAANIILFVLIQLSPRSLSDPNTLIAWGGNVGPRTANGEWWRLVTALFVHAGWLHLLASVAGLLQVGLMLERVVGPLAFAAVYFAAGIFSSVAHLYASPLTVTVGASGAIFGTYALLLASWTWGLLQRVPWMIPAAVVKRLAPAAAVFALYNLATDVVLTDAEVSGFIVGFAAGLVVARPVGDRRPSVRGIAAATTAVVAVAVVMAVPLRGMTDARRELEQVITVEERTATTYQEAANRFKNGWITPEALADVIDGAVLPELTTARTRVESLDKVPMEQQAMVAACKEYLRLRDEGWRARAAALRRASMAKLREADTIESASLDILRQIRTAAAAPKS